MNRSMEVGIQTNSELSPWNTTSENDGGHEIQLTPRQKVTRGKNYYYPFKLRESPCRHDHEKVFRSSFETSNRTSLSIHKAGVKFPEQMKVDSARIHQSPMGNHQKRGLSESKKKNYVSQRPPTVNNIEFKPLLQNKLFDQFLPSANPKDNNLVATSLNFHKIRRKSGPGLLPRVMKEVDESKELQNLEDFGYLNCVKITPGLRKKGPKAVQTIDLMGERSDYNPIRAPENFPFYDDSELRRSNNQNSQFRDSVNMTRLITAAQDSIEYHGSYEEDADLNDFMGSQQYFEELNQNMLKVLRASIKGEVPSIKKNQDFPLPIDIRPKENIFERSYIHFKKKGPPNYGMLLRRYKAATRPYKINSRPVSRENDVVLRQQFEMLKVKASATGQPIYTGHQQNRTKTK